MFYSINFQVHHSLNMHMLHMEILGLMPIHFLDSRTTQINERKSVFTLPEDGSKLKLSSLKLN